ncbi:intracellular short-chain-length polyhydroxyalkanoate depolymerase [Bacillus sp. 1NLA3E]|uniref:intracellular short-chain-length polyhydroxyalkanoate depolymerase n=1 Tax=Bacillus sp. 1NLA3E TaxID=666686 RepID=UPI0005A2DDF5|nr:alpha/beta hydrolase [Bacillus sp. 1NLA3E]
MTIKKVDLPNGETIAYREREGGKKKVLLIHGNMTSSKHWDLVLENMDAKFKLYAPDLRGFGESSYHKPIRSLKDFADDLKQFVETLDLKDFSIVGWSTGGGVGMQFVIDNPGYVDKLILLDSVSTRGYPFFGVNVWGVPDVNKRLTTMEQIKADPIRTIPIQSAYDSRNKAVLKAIWNGIIYDRNQPEPPRYEEYVDDMMTQRNLAEVYHALNTFNISHINNLAADGTNQAKEITIPVLILRGEHDLVINADMAEETMADLGENARFVELKNCGHSPLVDDLEQLLSVISEFLNF